jgi:hypothetical protein
MTFNKIAKKTLINSRNFTKWVRNKIDKINDIWGGIVGTFNQNFQKCIFKIKSKHKDEFILEIEGKKNKEKFDYIEI